MPVPKFRYLLEDTKGSMCCGDGAGQHSEGWKTVKVRNCARATVKTCTHAAAAAHRAHCAICQPVHLHVRA